MVDKSVQLNQDFSEKTLITNVASDSIRTQSSRVHPSPGAARNVWALPLTSSCNMMGEDESDHGGDKDQTGMDDKDVHLLYSVNSSDSIIVIEDIFDIIKNGLV